MPKTALDLTREEWKQYRIPKRIETPELIQRREAAWQTARQAADILRKQFGAQKVILFGSLARSFDFSEWSDIDLAVDLADPDPFYRAVAAVTAMSPLFEIDVVDLRLCPEQLRARIQKDGLGL